MMKTKILLWFFLLPAHAALPQSGFFLPPGRESVEIPFEYINNFIILNLTINNTLPLKFIYDTGAEHTILTKREISDVLHVKYEREFRIAGSDLKTELVAYLVRKVRLDIGDRASAPGEDILVLQEDYFRFEEFAGITVHGILAGNVFSKFMIKINYQRQVITLYDRSHFKMRENGYESLPVEIYRNKIYLKTRLELMRDSVAAVKLLVDTGAGLPMLLFSSDQSMIRPPAGAISSKIAMGLGGYLEGYVGRIPMLEFGSRNQHNIVTYFQRQDTSMNMDAINRRNGLLGNVLLSRFTMFIDYQNSKLWLKPSSNFKEAFLFDRSGLNLIVSGISLNVFTVQYVGDHSPASEADIRPGDEILRIGYLPTTFLSLGEIQKRLQKRPGKVVKLLIRRAGKRMLKKITLRDLI
jgi:hypothetical protein